MKKAAKTIDRFQQITFISFVVCTALLLVERHTSLDINNVIVHFILFYIAVAAVPLIGATVFSTKRNAIIITLFSALAACSIIAFFTWNGDWKTQTVIYRNNRNPNLTIEFRMRGDRFSFGYKKQIVKREKVLPYFDLVESVDTATINKSDWRLTNQRINELKILGDYVD